MLLGERGNLREKCVLKKITKKIVREEYDQKY